MDHNDAKIFASSDLFEERGIYGYFILVIDPGPPSGATLEAGFDCRLSAGSIGMLNFVSIKNAQL